MSLKAFKVDENNNFVFENGSLVLVEDVDAYEILLRQALATFRGEWFLDRNTGVPYYERIFDKFLERSALRSIFTSQIKTVPGTVSVKNLRFNLNRLTRELDVRFEVNTIYGVVAGSKTLKI